MVQQGLTGILIWHIRAGLVHKLILSLGLNREQDYIEFVGQSRCTKWK